MSRENTNKLIEMIDNGQIESRAFIVNLLNYLSESDVSNFGYDEGYLTEEEPEEEPEYSGISDDIHMDQFMFYNGYLLQYDYSNESKPEWKLIKQLI